ncbi:DUF2460 domain-containing protein [Rubellimicrobium sp. CFH 75288]|uniref:DUF2460 domain-containing protein n=1 Tax=Rubellimicrobium sp. CFH 75288 TaxID=2697034 RepID=UPI0014134458|nr:DUF2460 domain-containing protein [Rubellimicrobium sp. CFH 75288]NAZ35516.1 TIGR02217 family protein [Rubellimicrobium sp. CFH 75288]
MAFHDLRFPPSLSFGALGGPERRVEIVALASGHEERNAPWAHGRRRWDAGLGLRSLDDLHTVVAFFEARGGALHAFRWKDWADHKSCAPSATPGPLDQEIGTGDGTTTTFPLRKAYRSGPHTYWRPITRPVPGTVRVAVGATETDEGSDWTLEAATGAIRFARPPESGAAITAGYEFDVPVRFDTDAIRVQLSAFGAGEVPSIPVIEVRE